MDDLISRQAVIDMLDETKRIARQNIDGAVLMTFERVFDSLVNITNALPTIQPEILACGEGELNVQPEIIYCKDCSKHNVTISKAPYPFKEYICPLLAFRGEAQGHEFDYQFCAYGKKREVTE